MLYFESNSLTIKPNTMKKFYLRPLGILIMALFAIISANAQVPEGFSYQAIARGSSGNPLTDIDLDVRRRKNTEN